MEKGYIASWIVSWIVLSICTANVNYHCLRWLQAACHEDYRVATRKWKAVILAASVAGAVMILEQEGIWEQLLYEVLLFYLLATAIMDSETMEVYDFLHYIAGAAGLVLCSIRCPGWAAMGELLLFVLLQVFLFRRFYGWADCQEYIVCAVFSASAGGTMLTYLCHMGATFLMLLIVQVCRNNVNRKGNLKKPVALIPYIAGTAWMFL